MSLGALTSSHHFTGCCGAPLMMLAVSHQEMLLKKYVVSYIMSLCQPLLVQCFKSAFLKIGCHLFEVFD